jgi:hypothetical protein
LPILAGVSLLCATLLLANPARAQRIILLCPPEADTSLTEAFNRLRGELSMHGFEVEVQTSAEAISPESLAARADSIAAVASVSFVRSANGATADIKISDRVTGKTTIRTIATEGNDAPNLLALRAVELLRASLREFGPNSRAPKDIVGAAPDRASPSIKKWAETPAAPAVQEAPPPEPPPPPIVVPEPITVPTPPPRERPSTPEPHAAEPHWSLHAGGIAAALMPGKHFAYGGGATVAVRAASRLEVQLGIEAPWFGAHYDTAYANSDVHLVTAAGGLAYCLLNSRAVDLQIMGGLGVTRLTLFTTTQQPVIPMTPAAWVLMPRLGLGVNVALSRHWFWHTDAQIAAFLPRLRLHADGRTFNLGLPILQLGTGFGVRF